MIFSSKISEECKQASHYPSQEAIFRKDELDASQETVLRDLLRELRPGGEVSQVIVRFFGQRFWYKVHVCAQRSLQITICLYTDHKTLSGHVKVERTVDGQCDVLQRSNVGLKVIYPR